ncbi:MAG: hypothetical protein AAFY28_16045 [Actinomycetota bacterium]
MIVQWCLKGLELPDDAAARGIIDDAQGLMCNWWRTVHWISPPAVRAKLTDRNLDWHINHFKRIDPSTNEPFSNHSPFISLSAGTVERDAAARANRVRGARRTALHFGSKFGQLNVAYLVTCWHLIAPRPSVTVEAVGEEIRDLNSYRSYSAFQPEGEITAKIIVPDNQLESIARWERPRSRTPFSLVWRHDNPRFTPPDQLSNVRELIL